MARLQINYAKKDILPLALFEALEIVCHIFSGSDESRNEQIVKMKDDVIVAAKKHKFCKEVKYNVKQIGPHPCNREGEGLSDVRAQSRVIVIKSGGFSAPTIRPNCICMQENPITKHIEAFTLKQCAKSPKYARYEANMVMAGTLGAGHATHGFAQISDEVPCDLPKISVNGRMSKELCYQDPGIKSACEDGLWFDELDNRIEVVFPMIPWIVSAALNTVTQVAMGENWHSMLLEITKHIKDTWPSPNMIEIKKHVIKSQPPRPGDVSDVADFVRKWGSLPSGSFITELSELSNLFVDPTHIVPGSFFKTLFDLPVNPSTMPAEFVAALVFTHARSDFAVMDNVCRHFQKSDVTSIITTDKMEKAMQANGMITRFRSALESSTVATEHRLRLLADFKVAVVEHVIQRKGYKAKNHNNLEDIASEFASRMAAFVGGGCARNIMPSDMEEEKETEAPNGEFVTYVDGQVDGIEKTTNMAAKGFK